MLRRLTAQLSIYVAHATRPARKSAVGCQPADADCTDAPSEWVGALLHPHAGALRVEGPRGVPDEPIIGQLGWEGPPRPLQVPALLPQAIAGLRQVDAVLDVGAVHRPGLDEHEPERPVPVVIIGRLGRRILRALADMIAADLAVLVEMEGAVRILVGPAVFELAPLLAQAPLRRGLPGLLVDRPDLDNRRMPLPVRRRDRLCAQRGRGR